MKKVNMHATWNFQTRGVGSTEYRVKVYICVGLVLVHLVYLVEAVLVRI